MRQALTDEDGVLSGAASDLEHRSRRSEQFVKLAENGLLIARAGFGERLHGREETTGDTKIPAVLGDAYAAWATAE